MKIIALNGSGRRKGNTFKVLAVLERNFANLAAKNGVPIEFELLNLHDYKINHCIGCRNCMDKGENLCPYQDDVPAIKQKMHEADAIIFASPVYVGDVSSMMKALIDRLAYMCHRQELAEKYAFIIASVHSSGLNHTIQTMGAAVFSWGMNFIGSKGFRVKIEDTMQTVEEKYHKSLHKISESIIDVIEKKKYLKPSLSSLLVFRIQQKYRSISNDSIDYTYWKEKGWIDPNASFYYPHRTGKLKIVLAYYLFKIVDRLFVQ